MGGGTFTVDQLQRLLRTAYDSPADITGGDASAAARTDLSDLLRIVSPTTGLITPPTPQPAQKDWSGLIDLVRAAACRAREAKAQACEREMHFAAALQQAREGLVASGERAQSAEAMAREAQLCAEVQVTAAEGWAKAAEERACVAEQRARQAESWLTRVQDTILSEFDDVTVLPDRAAA